MQFIKDGQILSSYDIRNLHPNVSFGPSTYEELGYTAYAPASEESAPTPEQLIASLTYVVQRHLDSTAAGMGYDNIYTACTYADESSVLKFQQEGQALRAWRSLVWAHCHTVLEAVTAGTRAIPTAEELVAELPVLDV